MNLNKAVIIGRLTRDPEVRALPSGQSLASFSLATNRTWTDQTGNKQEAVEFHNIVTFGKLADICARYLSKGRLVMIEGRLQTRSWQDQQSGIKRYRTEIVAENMQMGPRPGGDSLGENPAAPQPARADDNIPVIDAEEPMAKETVAAPTNEPAVSNEGVNVKDIPF